MKVGDLVQIKSPAFYTVGAYHTHLFDEKMLVTDIIDDPGKVIALVECVSESGVHRFPKGDMEVVCENR